MSASHEQSMDPFEPLGQAGHGTYGEVPASHGISKYMWMFLGISLLVIFWQGWNVVSSSGDAHVWPSSDAVKVVLPAQQP
jgi:hypothetical protein